MTSLCSAATLFWPLFNTETHGQTATTFHILPLILNWGLWRGKTTLIVQVICRVEDVWSAVHHMLLGSTDFELDVIVLAPSSRSVLCKYSLEVKTTRFSLGIIQWKHSTILITYWKLLFLFIISFLYNYSIRSMTWIHVQPPSMHLFFPLTDQPWHLGRWFVSLCFNMNVRLQGFPAEYCTYNECYLLHGF